jgi:AraC-like DNA-binding protein
MSLTSAARKRPTSTWSGRAVRFALSVLEAEGRDVKPLLRKAGLSAAVVGDPDARMSHAAVRVFCEEAVKATGDDNFGLHIAEQVRPAVFDALGYVFRTSRTLGDGLQRLARYHRFVDDLLTLRVETRDTLARIGFENLPPSDAARPISEFMLTTLLRAARSETGRPGLDPVAVEFSFDEPADTAEHRRLFRSRLYFGNATNGLFVRRADLDLPFHRAEPELCEVLERRVRDVIARLPDVDSVIARARAVVLDELDGGKPTAANIGRRLAMSERSLHRRLSEEGTTLRDLLHGLRRELSERYIREGVSISETAFLLGYSEPSAFHRSFRRWTGRTPASYRREG